MHRATGRVESVYIHYIYKRSCLALLLVCVCCVVFVYRLLFWTPLINQIPLDDDGRDEGEPVFFTCATSRFRLARYFVCVCLNVVFPRFAGRRN